ncbi:hypothetical protein GCM10022409_14000 [Hymenobacter glaciei]|uniref:Antitoxin VbhA domain-containing protein n=1 Tax=Hymenobacter glaciei TaxID=877209 RepID=A0ABP7TTC5_9BACT
MAHDSRFGPCAQTPQQRAYVLHQLREALPKLKTTVTPETEQLCARYIAGELTWADVRRALDEAEASA